MIRLRITTLPGLLATAAAALPSAAVRADGALVPRAPANFRVEAFATDLVRPRALLVLPNGDVLVAEAGAGAHGADRVVVLRGTDAAGRAAQRAVLLDGMAGATGLALRRDRLLLASADGLVSCPYLVGQRKLHGLCRRLAPLPDAPGRAPPTGGALVLAPDESRLYAVVTAPAGSTVLAGPADGRGLAALGRAAGPAAGLALEPARGRPWLLTGGPQATLAPGDGAADGALALADGLQPAGLAFYARAHFPKNYRGGAFVSVRAAAAAGGDRVLFVPFAAGAVAGPAEEFLGGFADGERRGEPGALAVARDGPLLVADSAQGVLWRVVFRCAACTPDPPVPRRARAR